MSNRFRDQLLQRQNALNILRPLSSAAPIQDYRRLKLHFPQGDAPTELFIANRIHAVEHLSCDFRFEVEVLSDTPSVNLSHLMGRMVCIELTRHDRSPRFFNGHVFEATFDRYDSGFAYYRLVLVPWLALLRLRKDNRVFHNKSIEEQTESILSVLPQRDWRVRLLGDDAVMTEAVQFDETDYNYLHRRWESRGWHYYYEHRLDGHTLVLCGDSTQAEPVDGSGVMLWQGTTSDAMADILGRKGLFACAIKRFEGVRELVTSRYTSTTFDFKQPMAARSWLHVDSPTLHNQGAAAPELESYDWAGAYGYLNRDVGTARANRVMEAMEAEGKFFTGIGSEDHAQAGRCFTLQEQNMGGWRNVAKSLYHGKSSRELREEAQNPEYLILRVEHIACNNYHLAKLESNTVMVPEPDYRQTMDCIRQRIQWRPPQGYNSHAPAAWAMQTATVVGPTDERVYTDPYGRVRIQYHWDRQGRQNEDSSTWVRVATNMAGSRFGTTYIPRIGHEVLVQFQDGNPDRPLILASVPNARNPPPSFNNVSDLPDHKALSGIRTREFHGLRANQLKFDDTFGQISTQLATDHGTTQLNMGDLVHPREVAQFAKPRGQGFELRTDHSATLRSAGQMIISTWERLNAQGDHTSADEHADLLQQIAQIEKTLSDYAKEHQGAARDTQARDDLIKDVLKGQTPASERRGGERAPATLNLTSPAGISHTTPQTMFTASASNIEHIALGNIQHSAGHTYNLTAGEGIHHYAHKGGIKVISHEGLIHLQSQNNSTTFQSGQALNLKAKRNIKISANTITLIAADGSYIKIGGGIELGTSGSINFMGADLKMLGPRTKGAESLSLPGITSGQEHWIGLEYLDPDPDPETGMAEGIPDVPYEIHFKDGSQLNGTLNAEGQAEHRGVNPQLVEKVVYKSRPDKPDTSHPSHEDVFT